jgi:hypothetical protein
VQHATTETTTAALNLNGYVLIDPEKQLIKPGIGNKGVAH